MYDSSPYLSPRWKGRKPKVEGTGLTAGDGGGNQLPRSHESARVVDSASIGPEPSSPETSVRRAPYPLVTPRLKFCTWNLPNEYYAQIGESKFLALDRGSGFRRSFVGELVSAFPKPWGLT